MPLPNDSVKEHVERLKRMKALKIDTTVYFTAKSERLRGQLLDHLPAKNPNDVAIMDEDGKVWHVSYEAINFIPDV